MQALLDDNSHSGNPGFDSINQPGLSDSISMTSTFRHIAIKEETFTTFKKRIKEEFLKLHPEFADIRISDDFMLKKLMDFYLEN